MADTMEKRVARLEQHLRGFGLDVLTPEAAEQAEKDAAAAAKEAAKAAKEEESAA